MNPRQRKGVVLLTLTVLTAATVFVGVVSYVNTVSAQVGPMSTVLTLNEPVEALRPITPDLLTERSVPEKWVPEGALRNVAQTEGLVASAAYGSGAILQEGMLIPRPGLLPGYREVAIMVDAETGVAGKVKPGDRVDIIATIAGDDEQTPSRSELWVERCLVLEVGLPQQSQEQNNRGDFTSSSGVPVTFALSTADALRLAYGESFAVKLRLALRGAGDDEALPETEHTFTDGER